jgi:hypothetical protein
MPPRKKVQEVDGDGPVIHKTKTLFDHLNGITYGKVKWEVLTPDDQKTFDPYMVNRFLSMNPDYITFINDLQLYVLSGMPKEAVYRLYHDVLPKVKTFSKYVKSSESGSNKELLELVGTYYKIGSREAQMYVKNLLALDPNKLINIVTSFGRTVAEAEKLLK